jgi:hypothetical protein
MSDPLFTTTSTDAMTNARISRVEGAIPYIRKATQVYSSSSVKAPSSAAVNPQMASSTASGKINPSSGIQTVGSAYPPVISGNFGFTSTANSITIYWDGTNGSNILSLKRADGSNFTVPQGSLMINGLVAGTQYGFMPYSKITSQGNLSFVAGDAGNPQFAFSPAAPASMIASANQNQQMAVNEAVTNSFIYYTTGSGAGLGSAGVPTAYPGGDNRP